ncbi:hypothetical protein [uncultured Mycolicibacterium sp.]|uniref:hypothetical protein n=1 Tax=uncultured Mycolicibacterium sp. TaxID=2320817 RepID=UPI0026247C99|nr:hypothetical protein [uncultured Mycolicibacterium sp.]
MFVDVLEAYLRRAGPGDPGPAAVLDELTAPPRVAVTGLPGTGRRTAAAALRRAGLRVVAPAEAEAVLRVVAETVRPEDLVALPGCALLVLTKADLCGGGPDGPLAVAGRRAAALRARTGVPTVPLAAPPAAADVDGALLAALRMLAAEPADLRSADAFRACPHPLPAAARDRLLAALDPYGIETAVRAVADGADAAGLAARLRAASNVDAVAAAVRVPIRYRRTRAALARLRARAAGTADERLAAFLTGDEVVAAVAAEAAAVLAQHGLEPRPDPVHWRRYGRGPVGALHRACAADLCRAALRAVRR